MRDPKRIKRITDLLYKVWIEEPDLRFGQLISNFIFTDPCVRYHIFSVEDNIPEKKLKELYNKILIHNNYQKDIK